MLILNPFSKIKKNSTKNPFKISISGIKKFLPIHQILPIGKTLHPGTEIKITFLHR
jgi:hypothetical protein